MRLKVLGVFADEMTIGALLNLNLVLPKAEVFNLCSYLVLGRFSLWCFRKSIRKKWSLSALPLVYSLAPRQLI